MSTAQPIETGFQPTLTIRAHGNLTVQGWSEPRLSVRTPGDSPQVEQEAEDAWRLSATEDLQVYVPQAARLIVEAAHGDSQITGVGGNIIVQDCHGNLVLAQSGPATLHNIDGDANIHTAAGGLNVEDIAGNLAIHRIQGPLQVRSCSGDLAAKEIQGPVEIESVKGNANVKDVQGPLALTSVSGDLMAKNVAGPAIIHSVGGNAMLAQIHGPVQVENCGGDLAMRGVTGTVEGHAGGNASLRLQLVPGGHCQVRAGGDISCRVPPQISAQVRLVSRGNNIRVKRLGVDQERYQGNAEFTLGSGEGVINLEAGGSIVLTGKIEDSPEFQFGPFNVEMDAETQREFMERTGVWVQQYTDQIEAQMDTLTAQLDARLAQLGTGDEIASRVQVKVQQAIRKAEEKIAEAMRQAEQRARAAEREAERMNRRQRTGYGYTPPAPPAPPVPPTPPRAQRAKSTPVSDEERMVILRMVEEGKISVEQAEKLLAALDSAA